MHGYHGRALFIDLARRKVASESLAPGLLRQFVGGVGLGARLLYETVPRGISPTSPEAPLIFAGGPLAAAGISSSRKFAVACKSPLTGFIGDSLSSGPVSQELARMPFDALVLTGSAPALTYLVIHNDNVFFRDAHGLQGCSAAEASQRVRVEMGDPEVQVAAIGPAGEALVRYACITNDGRQAGRTGAGAVMGSKNLKAIAFRGNIPRTIAQPEKLEGEVTKLRKAAEGKTTVKYRGPGTIANLTSLNTIGALPSYNFRGSSFPGAAHLSFERVRSKGKARSRDGASRDWEHIYSTEGKHGPQVRSRVEYESLFALGPLCGIDDPDAVIRACALCDEVGIDTISTGGTIAWAMESFEKGLISTSDTEGLELRFGNGGALLSVIEKIGHRKGIGDLLAEGSRKAAEKTGKASEAWAMQVKGLEMPGYDPRTLKTLALGLAVSPRGACHNRSSAYDFDLGLQTSHTERGQAVAAAEDFAAILDSLILSKFLRRSIGDFYSEMARLYELITGWETSEEEFRRVGERTNNLRKAFNIREGWTTSDDSLPPRIFEGGALTEKELQAMVEDYYRARGWTPQGLVSEEKLIELGLGGLVKGNTLKAPAQRYRRGQRRH